jgi:hypothetical protein
MSRSFLLVIAIGLVALVACADPIHDAEVAALGPEAAGVSPGPMHRPGQPCLVCHGGEGPGNPTFVTAGTVYASQYTPGTTVYAPLVGGSVHLVDTHDLGHDVATNSVGNFYVTTDQWDPTFPLGSLSLDGGVPADGCASLLSDASLYPGAITVAAAPTGLCQAIPTPMSTAIDRGGVYASCAYCHFDPPGPRSPGHIYQQ